MRDEDRPVGDGKLMRIDSGRENVTADRRTDGEKILLFNDLPGYGKVALAAMIPIFSRIGFEVFTLPTALVSNTFNYPAVEIRDTTDYLRRALEVWEQLGFSFPAICTGYIASAEEADIVRGYCEEQKARGTAIFVDPIMADHGELYHGMPADIVDYLRRLCQIADLIVPNVTEACLLSGLPYAERQTNDQIREMARRLHEAGTGAVVITSANIDGQHCTVVSEEADGGFRAVPYTEIPVALDGTGDIFASLVSARYLRTGQLYESVESAMRHMERVIYANKDNEDTLAGIPIEHYLDELTEGLFE